MPANKEKYEAERNNGEEETSEAGKKTAKVALKGAADYFTAGKGGAVVDKLADTKLGQEVLNKVGKVVDNNAILNQAANKLNDSGLLDAADKGLSVMESGGTGQGGAAAGTGASQMGGKGMSSIGDSGISSMGGKEKSSTGDATSSSLGNESSDSTSSSLEGSSGINGIGEIFGLGGPNKKTIMFGAAVALFFIFGFITIIAGTDENMDADNNNSSDSSGAYCLTDNLQADDLCALRNQGKYEEWINLFGPIAQKDYSRSGVFASITIAQAMIESTWACNDIQNNLFGIKCHGYATCTNTNTHEEYNGQSVAIVDSFRTYPSVANSIEDHSNFLKNNSRYSNAGVFSAKDYKEQAYALKAAGYATDSSYATKLINQIETYNLSRFDVVVNTSSYASCGAGGTESASGWSIRTTSPLSTDTAFNYKSSNRGQCVWYAQGRAIEIVEDLRTKGKIDDTQAETIKNRLLSTYGNGGDWYENTRGKFKGSNNVNDLKAGSLISWKKAGGYGHVAVIEEVTDEKVTLTEGWATNGSSCPVNWGCINFLSRTVSREEFDNSFGQYYTGNYQFSGYVYFLELEG